MSHAVRDGPSQDSAPSIQLETNWLKDRVGTPVDKNYMYLDCIVCKEKSKKLKNDPFKRVKIDVKRKHPRNKIFFKSA